MITIQIILGSTRPGRTGQAVARWVHRTAKKRSDIEFELVDIADYNLPLLDEELPPLAAALMNIPYSKDHTKKWSEKIAQADAYLFVTPEYNRSVPGALKNAIDFLYQEWNDKAAGFVGYGAEGGARAVAHLRDIAGEVRLADVREELLLSTHYDFKDYQFQPTQYHADQLHKVIDQLATWATAMKTIRQKVPT